GVGDGAAVGLGVGSGVAVGDGAGLTGVAVTEAGTVTGVVWQAARAVAAITPSTNILAVSTSARLAMSPIAPAKPSAYSLRLKGG
ncbi:MAG: hypothetical protein M1370_03895, partial [Bacteroidetes bacterium]|nr:hypothetical protein [Bacteroidota bacterium]